MSADNTATIPARLFEIWSNFGLTCRDEHDALKTAIRISTKSPCRSKRGVVIWNPQQSSEYIQVGWNDQPYGFRCDGSDECKSCCGRTAIHAEESAIVASDRSALHGASLLHVKTVDAEPVASGPPSCIRCSGMIAEAGLDYVWLLHQSGLKRYAAREFHIETLKTLANRDVISTACAKRLMEVR